MKFGVLTFSYAGFDHFARAIDTVGHYSANLGDNAQTIASRHVYQTLGIQDEQVIAIDRDTLLGYKGPPAFLLMNGVFLAWSLPTPPDIHPLFVGFTAADDLLQKHRDWLKHHEPIGCRDTRTTESLLRLGVTAYTTGCVTITLPPRGSPPKNGRLLVVYGSGAGALPSSVLKHVPSHLLDNTEFIYHRMPTGCLPLSPEMSSWVEKFEEDILRRYRDEAVLVLTPLLHVASPCLAMNIPVVLCRYDLDSRFSYIRSILPIYTPGSFDSIDWNPGAIDVATHRNRFLNIVRNLIGEAFLR